VRTIDADELIKGLKEDFDDCDVQRDLEYFGIYDYIREQSTVYDVDKVIEELEHKRNFYDKTARVELSAMGYSFGIIKADAMNEAIEIVKRGGACERESGK
jgi:hypothetical protein